ncbi:hypothetical protein F4778DRAFT_778550 [Xylariomycetidae sp. FL2044]|nr:hypothetical protein F4778DRAFT_778550 [Xylariomycetidae sp. FL2044]
MEVLDKLTDPELLLIILEKTSRYESDIEDIQDDVQQLRLFLDNGMHLAERMNSSVESTSKHLRDAVNEVVARTRLLHNQIDAVRAARDCVPRFTVFRLLPPEIRTMIWGFALPHRVVGFGITNKTPDDSDYLDPACRPPSIAQACREARSVALRTASFRLFTTEISEHWRWFDVSRDTLDLDFSLPTEVSEKKHVFHVVQHVAFSIWQLVPGSERESLLLLLDPSLFPSLKSVSFVADAPDTRELGDPAAEARVYGIGGGHAKLVDLHDDEEYKRLQSIAVVRSNLLPYCDTKTEPFPQTYSSIWTDEEWEGKTKSWSNFQAIALKKWTSAREPRLREEGAHLGSIGQSPPVFRWVLHLWS